MAAKPLIPKNQSSHWYKMGFRCRAALRDGQNGGFCAALPAVTATEASAPPRCAPRRSRSSRRSRNGVRDGHGVVSGKHQWQNDGRASGGSSAARVLTVTKWSAAESAIPRVPGQSNFSRVRRSSISALRRGRPRSFSPTICGRR